MFYHRRESSDYDVVMIGSDSDSDVEIIDVLAIKTEIKTEK